MIQNDPEIKSDANWLANFQTDLLEYPLRYDDSIVIELLLSMHKLVDVAEVRAAVSARWVEDGIGTIFIIIDYFVATQSILIHREVLVRCSRLYWDPRKGFVNIQNRSEQFPVGYWSQKGLRQLNSIGDILIHCI